MYKLNLYKILKINVLGKKQVNYTSLHAKTIVYKPKHLIL